MTVGVNVGVNGEWTAEVSSLSTAFTWWLLRYTQPAAMGQTKQ